MDRPVDLLLTCAGTLSLPSWFDGVEGTLQRESDWLAEAVREGRRVYGANTFPGHLDVVRVDSSHSSALQRQILASHCIGGPPYYSRTCTRLMGYAKASSVAAGGSGLSPRLYRHLLDALIDPHFEPRVPKGSSYSCGDVIPGAHWASALLQHRNYGNDKTLGPGEALALASGSFVDVGTTLSLVPAFRDTAALCVVNSRLAGRVWAIEHPAPRREDGLLTNVLAFVFEEDARKHDEAAQPPVSTRATPQLVNALLKSLAALIDALDDVLLSSSANPLIDSDRGIAISNAGFMDPWLAATKSTVCEAVLFAMWACQARITAVSSLLDERLSASDALALIQVPKMTQAILEGARLSSGRRLFASGSATSRGVEDLWSFGTMASAHLQTLLEEWTRMERILCALLQVGEQRTAESIRFVRELCAHPTTANVPLPPSVALLHLEAMALVADAGHRAP